MVHGHPVVDADHHFIINPESREITNAGLNKKMLIQMDHNSERFSFEIDKIIEGHDMSLCNNVEVHYVNTATASREKSLGVYEIADFAVSETDNTKLVGTWLVSSNATIHAGTLSFMISFMCVEEGDVVYRWNTQINNTITVSAGINNGEALSGILPDIIAEWREYIYGTNFAYETAVKYGYLGSEEDWVNSIESLVGLENYVSGDELTTVLSQYATSSELNDALAAYSSSSALTEILASYVKTGDMNSAINAIECVKYAPQALSDEQKAQARSNIGLDSVIRYGSDDPETYCSNNGITPTPGMVYFQHLTESTVKSGVLTIPYGVVSDNTLNV